MPLLQLMPAGELVTKPVPVPPMVTVSAWVSIAKVAVTFLAAVMDTVHVPVSEHPPPVQPAKTEPVSGVAVSVTEVPLL